MTDRPIIFSGPMVRALLDGRKTQTRRVLKPDAIDGWPIYASGKKVGGFYSELGPDVSCAPFCAGHRLWVRENIKAIELKTGLDVIQYQANMSNIPIENKHEASERWGVLNHYGNRRNAIVPSIHMPRWSSRLTLTVTDVRVQRLRSITPRDAMAEGVQGGGPNGGIVPRDGWRMTFSDLWDIINAKRGYGWDQDPWVAAYTFTVEKRNIDA